MEITASNEQIRRLLAGRPARPADDQDVKTYTVIGMFNPEHPDNEGVGWREVVQACSPLSAESIARCARSGCEIDVTPDEEWIERMDGVYVLAIIEGDQRVTLQDPVSGEYDRHVG